MRSLSLLATAVALVGLGSLVQAADFNVTNIGATAYSINGASNPTLTLTRGMTYTFAVNALGHPFWIKTVATTGTGNAFNTGVTNNGTQSGTLTFVVPQGAPSSLFYNCEFHFPMTGTINIVNQSAVESLTWSAIKAMLR